MQRLRARRLRTLLSLMIIAAAMILIHLTGGILLWFGMPIADKRADAAAYSAVHQGARVLAHLLEELESEVEVVARLIENGDLEAARRYLQPDVRRPSGFSAMYVASTDGAIRFGWYRDPATGALRPAQPGWSMDGNSGFRQMVESVGPVWLENTVSVVSGLRTQGVGLRAGEHVVVGDLASGTLERTVRGFLGDAPFPILLVDSRGDWVLDNIGVAELARRSWADDAVLRAQWSGQPLPDTTLLNGVRLRPLAISDGKLGWTLIGGAPVGLDNPEIRIVVWSLAAAVVIAFIIAATLGPLWALTLERPIARLARLSRQVASGDYRVDWRPFRIREVDALASDLRTTAREIEAREAALRALNEELEQRVSARTEALQEALDSLRFAQDQLVQAETLAALGRMVAGVAHELNTPIGNALLAVTTLRESNARLADEIAQGLRKSVLDRFLDDLATGLDISERNMRKAGELIAGFKQIAVDQTSLQRRLFQLGEVVGETLMTLQPTLRRARIRVTHDIKGEMAMNSYPGPLGQVLANLINNAVMHAFEGRDGGEIRISAHAGDLDHIRIEVADDGCGIPASARKRVFEPFYTTRMGRGGTGLGLHIVFLNVTQVLGGTIALGDSAGGGTTFTLELPRSAP